MCCCVLAVAQPAERSEWVLTPRLNRAQELIYRGTFNEEASGSGVQFSRSYRMETRVLVLETSAQGADVAILTVYRVRENQPPAGIRVAPTNDEGSVCSVRLEPARIDLQGRVTPTDRVASFSVPLDSLPTVECGAFVEAPRGRIDGKQTWETSEDGLPARVWKIAGSEMINGSSCVMLLGVQKSDDWDRPRGDRAAWRRQDTVWVAPGGIAQRVERVIERREPARTEATQRTTLRYELDSNIQYPPQLLADRRREIQQARTFAESAAPYLAAPAKYTSQLEVLRNKINYHLENQPPTPYREAVLQVRRRVEAGLRGESPPIVLTSETTLAATMVNIGRPAPDFIAPDFTNRESARLRRWEGRPILMVFYAPSSGTAEELLQFAQSVQERFRDQVAVVGLAMTDDGERVLKQREELNASFPVLNGNGLRMSYGVDATPRMVLLDAGAVVRGIYVGWGSETRNEVLADIRRWWAGK
jgi:peroxiredoxin